MEMFRLCRHLSRLKPQHLPSRLQTVRITFRHRVCLFMTLKTVQYLVRFLLRFFRSECLRSISGNSSSLETLIQWNWKHSWNWWKLNVWLAWSPNRRYTMVYRTCWMGLRYRGTYHTAVNLGITHLS
uniref:Uncharacterized protein n=1 Tax=Cacopsylla melanoneura TaxID=428564 RepID=A0A8D8XDY4_9HEMI